MRRHRHTLKLLSHFDIQKRLVSYHEHNEITRAPEIVIELEQGAKVALVSDAGTPAISDPGYRLVSLACAMGSRLCRSGASAFVAALAASGMPADEFAFVGFLAARRRSAAKRCGRCRRAATLVLYEAPHRADRYAGRRAGNSGKPAGGNRARNHQSVRGISARASPRSGRGGARKKPARGEITLLIGPADRQRASKLPLRKPRERDAAGSPRGRNHEGATAWTAKRR